MGSGKKKMRDINPFSTITRNWKNASKADRIAVVLTALFFISFYFWGRVYFFFLAATFADTWIISSVYFLLFSKKDRKRVQKQLRGNAIGWYALGISLIVSFLFHFVYQRFNNSYAFYLAVLVETISLVSGGSSAAKKDEDIEEEQTEITNTPIGKVFLYLKLLFSSTFSSGMYFILGFSVLFGIWGISNISTYKNIEWDKPDILSIQAITRIEKRLPFAYRYRIHGYLSDSSEATIGWTFNQDSPRKFNKNDTLAVYPMNNSKWKYIAAEFAEVKRPLYSYNGMMINGMLITSAVFFLCWLGLMISITYPALDYLKNERMYKQWEDERQIIELPAEIIDEAIKTAQEFGVERGIDRAKRLLDKIPELSTGNTGDVSEYLDKLENQAVSISERIREGRNSMKMGIKELAFKFPQVKKKRIEMALNQGKCFSMK